MAQVFLDQECKQRSKPKLPYYSPSKAVLNSDAHNNHEVSPSVSSRLRWRPNTSKTQNIHSAVESKKNSENTQFSVNDDQSIDCIELDDSSSCDDPVVHESDAEDSPATDVEYVGKKKSKGFSCSICGHVTSSSQRFRDHLSHHTGIKHLECKICGKKFGWQYSFKSHMASHQEDNPNECNICGKKYCNKSSVKNHMLRVHGNPKKDFKCEECGKGFMTKAELLRHGFNHSKEKPFVCEYCGNAYRFKGALSVHYRIHSGEKPYKCAFCDKSFIHLSSAIGHRRWHTGEKPYKCKECGKLFRVKRAMTSHMSVHSEKKPFKCKECGKGFKSRSGYRVHLDFHLGVKRHTCKYCGRTFRAWCNMHKHMRRHIGEKPHKCELCGKAFIEKQELKNHMKIHENDNKKIKKIAVNESVVAATCAEVIPDPTLSCPSPNLDSPPTFSDGQHSSDMLPSHIDISDNQGVMYDCNLPNSMDKCSPEKCQLLQDTYVSQFLFPQQPSVQYTSQPVSVQNMYSPAESGQTSHRSACIPNMNTMNFNCISLNNQSFNSFSYSLPNSEEIVSKCKLCRSFFHSSLVLRNHLLDYHRIEEDHVDDLLA